MFDDDFEDIGVENNEFEFQERRSQIIRNGKAIRGKDITWVVWQMFPTTRDFLTSPLMEQIKKEFTASRKRQFDFALVHEYRCKYARKVGYLPCPWKLKVNFMSHCQEVRLETTGGCQNHLHEEDVLLTNRGSSNYRWTPRMNEFIEQCVQNRGKPR